MIRAPSTIHQNRDSLLQQLETSIRCASADHNQACLLMLRVQHGDELSALYGYGRIESLMAECMLRLHNTFATHSHILHSGDHEIALILEQVLNEGHAVLAAGKVLRSLAALFEFSGIRIAPALRIGIAVFPDHAGSARALLQCAESALADAETGRVQYRLYAKHELDSIAGNPLALEKELDQALDNGEFELFYQPKISLHTGLPTGAEALIRWRSPVHGLVPPDDFIPLATHSGQLKQITWSALNMALEHVSGWPVQFGPLTVSVNISPVLLDDECLVSRIADAMAVWNIRPERLILEITESAVMSNPEASFDTLRALRAKGVAVSIDDFGTGYSSLMNFRNIPATELKIDKSFVCNMLGNASDPIIIRNIIALANAFGLDVVAEGVEDCETMDMLAGMGITYAQGYFISRPLPAAGFVRFIEGFTGLPEWRRDIGAVPAICEAGRSGYMQQAGAISG